MRVKVGTSGPLVRSLNNGHAGRVSLPDKGVNTILCNLLPFERFAQLFELSVCLPTNLRELLC